MRLRGTPNSCSHASAPRSLQIMGTALAVLAESGATTFSLWGLSSFLISAVAESARVVGAQILFSGAER